MNFSTRSVLVVALFLAGALYFESLNPTSPGSGRGADRPAAPNPAVQKTKPSTDRGARANPGDRMFVYKKVEDQKLRLWVRLPPDGRPDFFNKPADKAKTIAECDAFLVSPGWLPAHSLT